MPYIASPPSLPLVDGLPCAASPSARRTELRCNRPGAGGEVNLSEAVFPAVGRIAASDHGFSSFPRWPLDTCRNRARSIIHRHQCASREELSQMRPICRDRIDSNRATSLALRLGWRQFQRCLVLSFMFGCLSELGASQCTGIASTPQAAADCAAHAIPMGTVAPLDASHTYSLAELIDLAERNNPQTRIAWESARQSAEELGIAKSSYYPLLAGQAAFADQRFILPFPKPLAPRGYVMVETPAVVPEVTLDYLIFDFGKREAKVDAATAEKLAAGAHFIQANQDVAFRVASAFYQLLTQQERLAAAEATLKTAQTTTDAAEYELRNGRSTLPDVLNARAETSQAVFDRESADGDEKIARVTLTEAVGVEPSPNITIDAASSAPLPSDLAATIDALIHRAMADLPELSAPPAPSIGHRYCFRGPLRSPPSGPLPITVNLEMQACRHGQLPSPSNGASSMEASEEMSSPKPSRRSAGPRTRA